MSLGTYTPGCGVERRDRRQEPHRPTVKEAVQDLRAARRAAPAGCERPVKCLVETVGAERIVTRVSSPGPDPAISWGRRERSDGARDGRRPGLSVGPPRPKAPAQLPPSLIRRESVDCGDVRGRSESRTRADDAVR